MKTLTVLIWIFTTAISTFFAYHTYTHTRIRYKDLESVMMQNLVVEKGVAITRQNTERQIEKALILVVRQGRVPKEMAIIQKATNVQKKIKNIMTQICDFTLVETTKLGSKNSMEKDKIELIHSVYIIKPFSIKIQDTTLKHCKQSIISTFDTQNYYLPFFQKRNLLLNNAILQVENQIIDQLVSQIGSSCGGFDKVLGIASAQSDIVKIGENYEALIFLTNSVTKLRPKMQISEGSLNIKGYVGDIEIKNVKAQNYNSEGKATKTLTGKITIKKADGSDTTFTLSTNYTVKKLVN